MTSTFPHIQRQSLVKPGVGTIRLFSGLRHKTQLSRVTLTPENSGSTYVVPECAYSAVIDTTTALAALRLMAVHRRPGHVCDLADGDDNG